MQTCHIYVRCSHLDSAESGLGLTDQEQQCRAYFDLLRLREPSLRDLRLNPTIYRDVAVSAYQKRSAAFNKRQQAGKLLEAIKPGDHILFGRLDRAFRNALEARIWMDHWMKTGVRVHFIDLQIDVGTATGMMLFGIMSYVAEWYSGTISERTKEGLKQKLLRDGCINGLEIGKKRVDDGEGKVKIVDDWKRLVRIRWVRWVMGAVSDRRVAAGLKPYTAVDAAFMFEQMTARREGRKPYTVMSLVKANDAMMRRDFARAARIWPSRYAHSG